MCYWSRLPRMQLAEGATSRQRVQATTLMQALSACRPEDDNHDRLHLFLTQWESVFTSCIE